MTANASTTPIKLHRKWTFVLECLSATQKKGAWILIHQALNYFSFLHHTKHHEHENLDIDWGFNVLIEAKSQNDENPAIEAFLSFSSALNPVFLRRSKTFFRKHLKNFRKSTHTQKLSSVKTSSSETHFRIDFFLVRKREEAKLMIALHEKWKFLPDKKMEKFFHREKAVLCRYVCVCDMWKTRSV